LVENKGKVILRRLGWGRLAGSIFVGPMLYIIGLIPGELPTDARLQKLGNVTFQLFISLRNVDFR
jgi:hypothetical protein